LKLVIGTDGFYSFAIFNYNNVTWTTGTASGGDRCTGLGGSPARAGFDFGDNRSLYTIPGSCTTSIVNLADTSNTNSMGNWVFRIDERLEPANCDTSNRLRLQPVFHSINAGDTIQITGKFTINSHIVPNKPFENKLFS